MKLQCPCGVKYAFEITPEMLNQPVTFVCPSCGQESGGGKFCQGCGHALAAAQAAQKFCGNCGTPLSGARFCGECGTPAG